MIEEILKNKGTIDNNLNFNNLNGLLNTKTKVIFKSANNYFIFNFTNIIGLCEFIEGIAYTNDGYFELTIDCLNLSILKNNDNIELILKIYSIITNLSKMDDNKITISTYDEYTEELLKTKISKRIAIIRKQKTNT